jgi:hypothetical protein
MVLQSSSRKAVDILPDQADPRIFRKTNFEPANIAWINGVMDRGLTIIDIGPSMHNENYPNATSDFYIAELRQIADRGYPKHIKVY